jgi:alkylhydroperoxidase family enzyme
MTAAVLPVSLGRLRELHPEGADALELMLERAWEAGPPGVAAPCRRRIRELIGAEAPGGGQEPVARAYLDLAEQFVLSVSEVTDEQVDAVRRLGGDRATYDFVAALYVLDLSERLDLLAGATFAPRPDASAAAVAAAPVAAPMTCAPGVGPRVEIPGGGMSWGGPLDDAMDAFAAAAMRARAVDPLTTEIVRQRCARVHDCRTCGSLRSPEATAEGLDEDAIERIARGEGATLGGRAAAALRLADAMIVDPGAIGAGLDSELRPWLDDAQIAELAVDVVKWSKQKFLVALRLETPPWEGKALLTFDERGEPVIQI